MSKSKIILAALMGAGININTSNWFGPKGSTSNKYQPHQGKQEIARRLRGKLISRPRRMWCLGNEGDRYPRYSGWHLRESARRPLILTSKILGCSVVMWP